MTSITGATEDEIRDSMADSITDLIEDLTVAYREIAALRASLAAANERNAKLEKVAKGEQIDIVFDAPPGRECGRFVEAENSEGKSISFGEWLQRPDGYWVLRFKAALKEG